MINKDAQELLDYFKALLYDMKITRDVPEKLADNDVFQQLDETLKTIRESAAELGNGNLSFEIRGKGYVLGSVKNLQASLRNLVWKTKSIASGDFSQNVDFRGEFSDAFNTMTKKLESSIQEIKEAQDHFELIFHTIPDATLITSMSEVELIAYNQAFLNTTKYTDREIRDEHINMHNLYLDSNQNRDQRQRLLEKLKKDGFSENMEFSFLNKSKEEIVGLVSSKIIHLKGEPFILSVIRDITSLKSIEQKLKESEERHRLLADNAADVIWTMTLEGRFTYISPSVEKLRGYTVEEVMAQENEEILCPGSLELMQEGLKRAADLLKVNRPFNTFRGELEQPCKDGTTVWTETTVTGIYNEEGKFIGILGVSRDISERRQMEEEIRRLSITDKLTQCYNRLKLDETLDCEFKQSINTGSPLSIMILDIDHFKLVNDTFGHQAGDSVLFELVDILKTNVGSSDVVGRWGGEEFLIILPQTDLDRGTQLAEKLRILVEQKNFSKAGRITVSIGVATGAGDLAPESIVSWADSALYLAKKNGRNRVEFLQNQ